MAVAYIDGPWKKPLPALGWGSVVDDLPVHSLDLIVIVSAQSFRPDADTPARATRMISGVERSACVDDVGSPN